MENTSNNSDPLKKRKERIFSPEGLVIARLTQQHNFDCRRLRGIISGLDSFNQEILSDYLRDNFGSFIEKQHMKRVDHERKVGSITYATYSRLRNISSGRSDRSLPHRGTGIRTGAAAATVGSGSSSQE